MLKVKGDDVFWNGIPVHNLKLADMSALDRFEFLCAISTHDPLDVPGMYEPLTAYRSVERRN